MHRPISMGQSDFRTIRKDGNYYVDKTALIGEVLRASYQVLLLPRPRRFGKTLNQTMLQAFFDDCQNSAELFEGLSITQDAEAMKHLNAHPTVFLTLKDMSHSSWDVCYRAFKSRIAKLINQHLDRISSVANELQKRMIADILNLKADQVEYEGALLLLTELLERASGKRVLVLLDEYDNAIQRASTGGYLTEVLNFLRNFMGAALKDNRSLFRAVVTGVLRVGRESIYSDLNNLGVYSVLEKPFSSAFGFTQDEVRQILADYQLLDQEAEVRHWYNGYRFGETTIYNPWSILAMACAPQEPLQPYWLGTSSNDLARELIVSGQGYHLRDLQALLSGEALLRSLEVSVSLRDLQPDSLWNLFLFSGYLTTRTYDPRTGIGELVIPNYEIRLFFQQVVLKWFGTPQQATQLVEHLLAWRMDAFAASLSEVVATILSYHDLAGKQPERIYHAFIIGLLVQLADRYELHSNLESGRGRADLLLIPKQGIAPGFVLEFKSAASAEQEQLDQTAQAALAQIFERDYAALLRKRQVTRWLAIGLAFHGKQIGLAWRASASDR